MKTVNLIDLIPRGKKNAIKVKKIADHLGIPSREVYREVERLRNKSVLIASSKGDIESPAGLFIPGTSEEAIEYLNRWDRELDTKRKTYEKQKNALNEMTFD